MPNESLAERLNGKLHWIFVALILAYVAASGFRPVMDNVDIGWDVSQGRWMVQHASIYREDLFNYPNLHHRAIDEYPLFQIVIYAAWSLGWWGPCLLTAMAYVTLVGVVLRAAHRFQMAASVLAALAIGMMLLFFQISVPLRPHLVTYLCVTVLGIFLLRHREATNWTIFWPMALLQVAWVNCHSAFVMGPAMVALFGCEIIARRFIRDRSIPWGTIWTWLGVLLLMLLACFANPYGWERFYPPFFQDQLESIRAYVGEMEPLGGGMATLYGELTLTAVVVVVIGLFFRGGTISISFLLLAFLFYVEAQSAAKAWPIFGLFIPLLVLSSGAFATNARKQASWLGAFTYFIVAVVGMSALLKRFDSSSSFSLQAQWRELAAGRSELSLEAIAWMKANHVEGRLFHRCEDGGVLQQEGFDHGETFSDTGFGKYDEAFIHEVGLVNERPPIVPRYLSAYRPDFVVCSTFCPRWPHYLEQSGFRLIFYSPNSMVWARTGARPDLPTVSDEKIKAAFTSDLAVNGRPADVRLFGRNLIALNSLGLEDFAFSTLTSLPPADHRTTWYWEAARYFCFSNPPFSSAHREALQREAEALGDDHLTAEFRAICHNAAGDIDGAARILEGIPKEHLGNPSAELLLKIYLDQKNPGALELAQRPGFDLRNGHHWQYLAQAEEAAGHPEAAARAWQKAVFYYPDDTALMEAATAFAAKRQDVALTTAIQNSTKVYGQP